MTCEDYVKTLEEKAKKKKQTNNENRKDKRWWKIRTQEHNNTRENSKRSGKIRMRYIKSCGKDIQIIARLLVKNYMKLLGHMCHLYLEYM